MARLGRKGRILKWAGLVLSLLIFCLWVAPLSFGQRYVFRPAGTGVVPYCDVDFMNGSLAVIYYEGGYVVETVTIVRTPMDRWTPFFGQLGNARVGRWWYVIVPLWMPFLIVALPTGLLWWCDRRCRIPPGYCQKCGYNLTGNVSGVCPECGAEARSSQLSGVSNQSDRTENG